MAFKAKDRKAPQLGPKVRVEVVRLNPAADESGLQAIVNGTGLSARDKDGFRKHGTATSSMWRSDCTPNLSLEFELPEPVPLGAIEVWNFNAEWQTTNGLHKADVAVSADGAAWQTVLRGVEFAEADGRADYDEPVLLKLNGVTARKVRFENMAPWGAGGKVGLSEVVFHQAEGPQAGPLKPEDGATVSPAKAALEWVPGQGATEHRVYFGTAPDKLEPLGTAKETGLDAPPLKPDTAWFWRVDEVQSGGKVVTGRVARFNTGGQVAWWKLDETEGAEAKDASGHKFAGRLQGQPRWAPAEGRPGRALEFDGEHNFIDCGNASEFDLCDGFTVSAWIKVRKFDKTHQAIITKGDNAWRLQRLGNTGKATLDFNEGGNVVRVESKHAVDDGQWHHVAGLHDGRRASLYVDGELQNSATVKSVGQNSAPLMIGNNGEHLDRSFNGWMADVHLYSYALSAEEVQALYRDGQTERAAK